MMIIMLGDFAEIDGLHEIELAVEVVTRIGYAVVGVVACPFIN